MDKDIRQMLARLSSGEGLSQPPLSIEPLPHISGTSHPIDLSFKFSPSSFSGLLVDGFEDALSKGYVSFEQAEMSLQAFQAQAFNFPFVIVDPRIGVDVLRRKRSFLLLTIITFAASWNVTLQAKLENELKELLCKRLIMKGEKSLDLLQGLLVYINWYADHKI
jgi:hypothetical protein